jgi:tetratricopeptide (TPR) repeat protein
MKLSVFLFFISMQFSVYAQEDAVVIGNEYYKLAQYEAAEKQYRAALTIDKENTTAQYNLALSLYKQKKYTEASELFRKLGETTPEKKTRAPSFYNEGVIYSKQKELEKSIDAYKSALRQDPDDQQARENLQKALLELKKQNQDSQSQQKKQNPSSLTQKQAEQKLKNLEAKEKDLQERLQKKYDNSSETDHQSLIVYNKR